MNQIVSVGLEFFLAAIELALVWYTIKPTFPISTRNEAS